MSGRPSPRVFRDYGYRRLRAKARLKFLIKDWGIEKFSEVLETEYLKRKLIDGPAPEPLTRPIDHVGVQRLKNGLNAVGVAPIAGRVSGTILSEVADLAEQAGSDGSASPRTRSWSSSTSPDDKLDELGAGLDALGLPSQPSHWRRNLMACTGIEFCKLSFAETRSRSQSLVPELEQRLEDLNAQLDVPVTDQHQRLPELVCPHPGRRHRLQGSDGRRRRRSCRGLPGSPRRQPRSRQWVRPKAAPAQGDQRRSSATTSTGWFGTS